MQVNEVMNAKVEFLFPDLTYKIIGLCIEVHKEIGYYGREKQYSDAFEKKLVKNGLSYARELVLGDSGNIIDFLIQDLVLVEFKTVPFLNSQHFSQVKRYLYQSGHKLGLLVNFREKRLKPKRVLNINNLREL